MQTKNKVISVLALAVLVFGLITLTGAKHEEGDSPIKIGASLSLTGVAADFGDMSKKAMELAVDEINSHGGVKGRKIQLSIEDDQTDPKAAVSAFRKLVDIERVDAVVGGIFDFTAQPVLPLAEKEKVTYISPVNFAIAGTFEMNPYTFVMYPNFEKVVNQLASVIKDKEIRNLGMIRFESGFSKSIEGTLSKIMINQQGGSFIPETYKAIGSSDFRTNILKISKSNIDAVFLDMLDFDIEKYLNDSEKLGFSKPIIGYTTLRDVLKKDIDKSGLEGTIMLDWEIPSEEFSSKFFEKYGEYPRRGANKSYDSVYMLAEAIANSDNRSEVPTYIKKHSFKTVNGEFLFGDNNAVTDTPVKVFEVHSGKLVEIKKHAK